MRRSILVVAAISLTLAGCGKKTAQAPTATGTTLANVIVSVSDASSSVGVILPGAQPAMQLPSGSPSNISAVSIPSWCIKRYGPHGEYVLDPNDPAFDCGRNCVPPFSTCAQYERFQAPSVQQYQAQPTAYPTAPTSYVPSLSGARAAVGSSIDANARFLAGLTADAYGAISGSDASSSAPEDVVPVRPSASSFPAANGGATTASLSQAFSNGDLLCGRGFTMPILVGGNTPLSGCIVNSPWKPSITSSGDF